MTKETLTLSNITQDLRRIAFFNLSNIQEWRFSYIIPITLIAVIIGAVFQNIWIGLLIFSIAAYHIIRYVMECKDYRAKKKAIKEVVDRADIAISIERFDYIATETIYEPHTVGTRGRSCKTAKYYCFSAGSRWRVPDVDKHYKWSKEYDISSKGLENISIQGDEFYYISLQGNFDISYIYPCKNFVLDEKLKEKQQDE